MQIAVFLIIFPLLCAPVMYFVRDNKVRAYITYAAAAVIASASVALTTYWVLEGSRPMLLLPHAEAAGHLILAAELALMVLVLFNDISHFFK